MGFHKSGSFLSRSMLAEPLFILKPQFKRWKNKTGCGTIDKK
ncbi:hypothetical protein HOLDEFILI_03811 [Holdemania filiformis DSM 12042]|uniref:Uncharacterized protein n=1 Tax=Holdemania filiformis DSM 12042 TaxID=545696 RepID=B9YD96_9FIRM|nr:hypothetical protein HOLDEFILI_03811 [Holdemania filiformis DSM 12042]